MTKNQIEYAKLLETRRSNVVNESLTAQRNALTQSANDETKRANVAKEGLTAKQIAEAERSARAKEAETSRHNIVTEGIQQQDAFTRLQQAREQARANLASESLRREAQSETARSNLVNEALGARRQVEVERSNLATESETKRHNEATELVNVLRNLASSGFPGVATTIAGLLGLKGINLGAQQIEEITQMGGLKAEVKKTDDSATLKGANANEFQQKKQLSTELRQSSTKGSGKTKLPTSEVRQGLEKQTRRKGSIKKITR